MTVSVRERDVVVPAVPGSHDDGTNATPGVPGAMARAASGMHTRMAVLALVAATLAIGAAYGSALAMDAVPAWAPWLMATGVPLALVAVMTLGAARRGRVPGVLLAAFALVGLMLVAGFALALLLPGGGTPGTTGEPLLLGLPRRAGIIVYGIGLLPVLVLPVAYAMTFEAQTLRDEDLERVRAAARDAGRGVRP